MGKLKIKDIEGELTDIHQFFSAENCDLSSYLGAEKKQNNISILWIGAIYIVFFVLCCCIWNNVFCDSWNNVATLGAFSLCFLIIGVFYNNFRNIWITGISIIACLSIVLLSLNVYSPKEIAKKIEQATIKKYGQ